MDRELRFIVRFRNEAARQLKGFGRGLTGVAGDARKAATALKGTGTAADRAARDAQRAATRIRGSGRSITESFSRARSAVFLLQGALLTLGLGVGLGAAIGILKDFEFEMARVRAITGATDLEFTALVNTARELGATTVFKARDVGEGIRLLAQAGFEANEAIAAIPGTLNLAIAGATDLGTATDITANTVRGFTLEAGEASRVADVLAATANNANTTVTLLGEALKFVAPVAASTDQSLEQVAAAVGTLSDAGLKGTLAGTGLRRVLVGLVNVTPKAEAALTRLGLTTEQVDPRVNSLSEILTRLRDANITAAEAFDLFGLRGGPAALVLTQLADRFRELNDITNESAGEAERVAEIMKDTLAGDLKILQSAFEELILQQNGFSESLRGVVQDITGVIQALNGTLDPLAEGAARFREIAGDIRAFFSLLKALAGFLAAGIVVKLVLAIAGAVTTAAAAFAGATTVAAGLGLALAGLSAALFPIAGLVAAAGAAWLIFSDNVDDANAAVTALNETTTSTADFIKEIEGIDGKNLVTLTGEIERRSEGLGRQIAFATSEIKRLEDEIQSLEGERSIFDLTVDFKIADLREQQVLLRDAIEDSADEQQVLNERLEEARKTGARLSDIERSLKAIQDGAQLAGETIKDVLTSGIADAEEAIEKSDFKIAQLQLGVGAEAEFQREVNKRLKAAGLTVPVTPEIEAAQGALNRVIRDAQKQLQSVDLTGPQREALEAIIEANRTALSRVDETIQKRRELADQLRDQVALEQRLTEENEKQEELNKAREKLTDDIRELNVEFGRELELLASGVQLRENERKVVDLENRAKAEGIELDQEQLRLLRDRAAEVDQARGEQQLTEFIQNRTRALRQEAEAQGLTRREAERLKIEQELVNEAIKAGIPITDEYIKALGTELDAIDAVREANDTFSAGFSSTLRQAIEEGASSARFGAQVLETSLGSAFSAIDGFLESGKLSFADFARSLITDIAKLSVRLLAFQALKAATQSGGGGGGGGALGGILGALGGGGGGGGLGGLVGALVAAQGSAKAKKARVPAAIFANAQRFQDGGGVVGGPGLRGPGLSRLGRDRVPALLSPGEVVLNERQQRAAQGGRGGPAVQNISVQIVAKDPNTFRENEGQVTADLARALSTAQRRNN